MVFKSVNFSTASLGQTSEALKLFALKWSWSLTFIQTTLID